MFKTYKYQLTPTEQQKVVINKHIGASRFIFNLALETKRAAWSSNRVNIGCFDLMRQLPELKKECPWLKEVNSQSLQQSIINLDNAFKRFFKYKNGFPKFKKKANLGSFAIPQGIMLENSRLSIPKFREGIRINLHRPIEGIIKQATINVTPTGKYFVCILSNIEMPVVPKTLVLESTTIGLDLGIRTFITTSNEERHDNPKFFKNSLSRLRYLQRKYSKHKNRKVKRKLSIIHEKIANQRKDFLHKVSSELIKNHDSIAIETLKVKDMLKNHNLAQAISDAGWSIFVSMLEYKANWHGKNILKIGAFEPSSKICSNCGFVNKELSLKDKEWTCKSCNSLLDRDLNAAINIKNIALKEHLSVERRLEN